MPNYSTPKQRVEHGLDTIPADRTVTVSLRDLMFIHQTLAEFVQFFHQPMHYPDLKAVEEFLGTRGSGGALDVLSEAQYHRIYKMIPPDIEEAFADGERFAHPLSPVYFEEKTAEFPAPIPEIPVSDIAAAVDYYRRCMGFTLDWGDEDLGLAGISKGKARMFLANQGFRTGYGNAGPTMIWLNLDAREGVDELYRFWSENGVKLMSAPEDKPWGLHEFTATDLDGNLFRVFYDYSTPERIANGKL